jgi:PHD/YefM family antitoxin component YafN of YafNO toxin-antitoxin module
VTSITLTELNQNPSRATRLADHGEVIVMRRGHAAYRITKIESSGDPLDELLASGLARPARSIAPRSARRFPTITDVDLGAALDAERARFDGLV